MSKKLLLKHSISLFSQAPSKTSSNPSVESLWTALKFVILNRHVYLPYINKINTKEISDHREGTRYTLEVIFTPTVTLTEFVDFRNSHEVIFNIPGSDQYPSYEFTIRLHKSAEKEPLLTFCYYQLDDDRSRKPNDTTTNPEILALTRNAWKAKDKDIAEAVVKTFLEDSSANFN